MSTDYGAFREFVDGETLDAGNLDAAWYTAIRTAGGLRDSSVGNFPLYESTSMLSRVFHLVNAEREVATRTYVIDSSADWRDRLLLVMGSAEVDFGCIGMATDSDFNPGRITRIGYTGTGEAAGQGSRPDYGIVAVNFSASDCWLYADDVTGELKLDVGPLVGDPRFSLLLQIYASAPVGQRHPVTVNPQSPPSASNGSAVRPYHLNHLQDHAVMTQVTGPGSLPLGRVRRGDPPIAEDWTVHGEPARQPLNGQAWRWFSAFAVATRSRTIDSSIDWRDRQIAVYAVANTTDIKPGAADDDEFSSNDCDAGVVRESFYSGPGQASNSTGAYSAEDSGIYYAVDDETGALFVYNSTGTDVYIGGWIMASPQLGPRTVVR